MVLSTILTDHKSKFSISYNPTKCHQKAQRTHLYMHCQGDSGASSKCLQGRKVLLSHSSQLPHLFYVNIIFCHLFFTTLVTAFNEAKEQLLKMTFIINENSLLPLRNLVLDQMEQVERHVITMHCISHSRFLLGSSLESYICFSWLCCQQCKNIH